MTPPTSTNKPLKAPLCIEPSILAIVVLYKMSFSESNSVRTLLNIFSNYPDLARHFTLILYDNSPILHADELSFNISVHYRHDPSNAGLAAAYNYALEYAEETGHSWLLLLDQDTTLTYDFVAELIASAIAMEAHDDVASIVPKLVVHGKLHSPAAHFIDQLRHPYKRATPAVSKNLAGVQRERLSAYNSGASFKVSALRSIGGFPVEYWLDYLDHAIFHSLSIRGFCMYIMNATLEHDPSQANPGIVAVWRERNLLFAQTRFVMQTGNFLDRLLYRIWLLRRSKSLLLCYPNTQLWRQAALQAFLLNEAPDKRGPTEIRT